MDNSEEYYKMKYFKYKFKYLNIKQIGGTANKDADSFDEKKLSFDEKMLQKTKDWVKEIYAHISKHKIKVDMSKVLTIKDIKELIGQFNENNNVKTDLLEEFNKLCGVGVVGTLKEISTIYDDMIFDEKCKLLLLKPPRPPRTKIAEAAKD